VCVLPDEFSLIQLHGFMTALPWPRQCCLGFGLMKTASPTSLVKGRYQGRQSTSTVIASQLQDNAVSTTPSYKHSN